MNKTVTDRNSDRELASAEINCNELRLGLEPDEGSDFCRNLASMGLFKRSPDLEEELCVELRLVIDVSFGFEFVKDRKKPEPEL
mmetsp:Transcript_31488/g.34418  ORF Transcript_31488/g.34418 Transcript_31488/m.34418 type:complete len:84 (-) Transcript_31488:497-748(-)